MESSQLSGDEEEEECSSSESGWTTYLASPMHGVVGGDDADENDEGECDDGDGNGSNSSGGSNEGDEDDDDSMASDASSGPAHFHGRDIRDDGFQKLDGLKKNHKVEKKSDESENKMKNMSTSVSHRGLSATSFYGNHKVRKGKLVDSK